MNETLAKHLAFGITGAFFIALLVGLALIRFRTPIERITKPRCDHLAVQASHTGNPMRLGGVAILAGLLLGAATLVSQSRGNFSYLLFLSLLPVFLAGFLEDLGYRVSVRLRFLASVVAASLAVVLLGQWISRGDLPVLDALMRFAPVGVFLTIVLAALFCHAVNLIDGMNGLAATAIIATALGIAYVAEQVDFRQAAVLAVLLAAATLGFLVLNWPRATLFLGDAGAYGLGHILVWLGISLIATSPEVAVPAVILIGFYPFVDLFHSVLRRRFANQAVTQADRMHLHQKIRRGLEIVWIGNNRRHISNPLTTVFMLPMVAGPVFLGALLWDRPLAAWVALFICSIAFAMTHVLAMNFFKRIRRRSKPGGTPPAGRFGNRSVKKSARYRSYEGASPEVTSLSSGGSTIIEQ